MGLRLKGVIRYGSGDVPFLGRGAVDEGARGDLVRDD